MSGAPDASAGRTWIGAETLANAPGAATLLRRLRRSGLVPGPGAPPAEWLLLLRDGLAHLPRRPGGRGRFAIPLLIEAAIRLHAPDLLGAPPPAPRLGALVAQLPASLRDRVLEELGLAAQAERPTRPAGLPPAALGLAPAVKPGAAPGRSVIIVQHGRAFLLRRLLTSIGALGGGAPLEVLLHVNGGPPVPEALLVSLLGPAIPFRILHAAQPVPVGVARNRLVALARHDQIVSLDSDMVLLRPAEAIVPDLAPFAGGPGPAFWNLGYLGVEDVTAVKLGKYVEPRAMRGGLRLLHNRTLLRLTGAELAAAEAATRLLPGNRLSGGASLFDRESFRALGGFSEAFDIGWEDLEFSLRLAAGGGGVVNPVSLALFHGHLMPFCEADLAAETGRFEPSRLAPGLAVLAAAGCEPEAAARSLRPQGAEEDLRRCPLKLSLLDGLGLPLFEEARPGPLVGWVLTTGELASPAWRDLLAGLPPLWRNAVMGAAELGTLHRLAASLAGCDAVVLGPEALRCAGGRAEPFAPAFRLLNERVAATILLPGTPRGSPEAAALARLLPRCRIDPVGEAPTPSSVGLALARATFRSRQRYGPG